MSVIAQRVLDIGASKAPGASIAARVRAHRDGNTRFARNQITSTGDAAETSVSVRVAFGKRHATTTTNQIDEASLAAAVDRAAAMAKLSPEDPEDMPLLGAQNYARVPSAFDPATERLGEDTRAAAAQAAIAQARGAGLAAAGFYEHEASELAYATSAGASAWHAWTSAQLTLTARTSDGSGSGWAGAESERAADVDAAAVAKVAVEKGARSAKPRALDPGRYTVVLEPAAVADILGFLVGSLDARRADEGRSFFAKKGGGTKLGEKLFADGITLVSDPLDPATPSMPFDWEGLPLAKTTWIDRGVVSALHYSRYWAAKQGKQPTGDHGAFHLAGGGAGSIDDLVSGTKRGLLVTRFWYTRWLDPPSLVITGLTRDGVFLIENGKIVAPVNNFRFNDSPAALLRNVEAMTRATFRVPSWRTWRVPAIRAADFNMASRSDAV